MKCTLSERSFKLRLLQKKARRDDVKRLVDSRICAADGADVAN